MCKRTKIIATLGPASDTLARIKSLLTRGVDVVRVNLSHGDHQTHKNTVNNVRQVAQELGNHTAILMDLCGPKIRTGVFESGSIQLQEKHLVVVTTRDVIGEEGLIPCQYSNLHKDMKVGQRILLDDGKFEIKVEEIDGRDLYCMVVYGGILKDKKGMNLPDTNVSSPSLTPKDKDDVALAIECMADFLALSFVRNAQDIKDLKVYLDNLGVSIPIIAKIERPEAVENIDEILEEVHGIMIARGDLGIELEAEKVPLIQNHLIEKARMCHKPVIVATQMMESMIENSRPTRAEIGDVANAVMHSADAVMLSGETSVGKYPLQTVEFMERTIREIERDQITRQHFSNKADSHSLNGKLDLREATSHAAMNLANDLHLRALVVPTRTGTTAQILSSYRPSAVVLGVSHDVQTCCKLSLHWGVVPLHLNPLDFKDWSGLTKRIQQDFSMLKKDDRVLIVSGFKQHSEDSEPVLKVLKVQN